MHAYARHCMQLCEWDPKSVILNPTEFIVTYLWVFVQNYTANFYREFIANLPYLFYRLCLRLYVYTHAVLSMVDTELNIKQNICKRNCTKDCYTTFLPFSRQLVMSYIIQNFSELIRNNVPQEKEKLWNILWNMSVHLSKLARNLKMQMAFKMPKLLW